MAAPRKMHDVTNREAWDKIVLLLAFLAGVGGGIALKVLGFHPFYTAGYSAAVLVLYALTAYVSTELRLEPEVIGDNSWTNPLHPDLAVGDALLRRRSRGRGPRQADPRRSSRALAWRWCPPSWASSSGS